MKEIAPSLSEAWLAVPFMGVLQENATVGQAWEQLASCWRFTDGLLMQAGRPRCPAGGTAQLSSDPSTGAGAWWKEFLTSAQGVSNPALKGGQTW